MDNLDDIYTNINTDNKCIGPCYPGNKSIVHPTTGNIIRSNDNFCPIKPYNIKTKNQENNIIEYTKCSDITYNYSNNIYNNIINDNIDYNIFLSVIYNIYSFYDTITYIQQNSPNIYTENRLIKLSWTVFSDDIDNIPNIVYTYYKDKFVKQWEPEFKPYLQKNDLIKDNYYENVDIFSNNIKTIKLIIHNIITRQTANYNQEDKTIEIFSKENIDFYIKNAVYNIFKNFIIYKK